MRIKYKGLNIDDVNEILRRRGLQEGGPVQRYIDSEVLRLCSPYIPRDNGALIKSGTMETKVGGGEVNYDTPYARRWYYEPANFSEAPKRGNYWFERMKNEGGREKILDGVIKLTGGKR